MAAGEEAGRRQSWQTCLGSGWGLREALGGKVRGQVREASKQVVRQGDVDNDTTRRGL